MSNCALNRAYIYDFTAGVVKLSTCTSTAILLQLQRSIFDSPSGSVRCTLQIYLADIGREGRKSDGGVLAQSQFGQALRDGTMVLPSKGTLGDATLPYYLVGDEGSPLRNYLMRPYPGRGLSEGRRIFNYRLSRAVRTIQNAFGNLSARWRLFF